MKAFHCLLPCLALVLLLSACSREREITGQIFVVTKSRDNVKMGLVSVHVVTEAQLKTIAAGVLKTYKQARQDHEHSLAQARVDLEALRQIEADLNSVVSSRVVVTEFVEVRAEILNRRKKLEAQLNDPGPVALRDTKDRIFKELPSAAVKTDADGRFNLKAEDKVWLLARAERTIANNEETYFWAGLADPHAMRDGGVMLLSNDSLIDEPNGVLDFVLLMSGEASVLTPMPKMQISQSLRQWSDVALEKVKTAIARAEDEDKARARADELKRQRLIAEAQAASERLVGFRGAAMRRSGFTEQEIERTFAQGGTLVAWGANSKEQCAIPVGLSRVVAVTAGAEHTIALKSDGSVIAWGSNFYGQSSVPPDLAKVVAVAAGNYHTIALKNDGTMSAWGSGREEKTTTVGLSSVVAIAASDHNVILMADGTVEAWGYDLFDQCAVPTGLSNVEAIAAGGNHSVVLKQDGTVMMWGDNKHGQCSMPGALSSIVAIAAGGQHTVALKRDGSVVAWGDNTHGQCAVPTALTQVKAIAAGKYHTVALKQDGLVVAWGANSDGQCTVPSGLSGVVAIAAGGAHTVALKLD